MKIMKKRSDRVNDRIKKKKKTKNVGEMIKTPRTFTAAR